MSYSRSLINYNIVTVRLLLSLLTFIVYNGVGWTAGRLQHLVT